MKTNNCCPICDFSIFSNILELDCGNFDGSKLYPTVRVSMCELCGHIYNRLSMDEIAGLTKYYNEEYAPSNIYSEDKSGDRPGGNNKNTLSRYDKLYGMVSKHISQDVKVLDVGCALGGFLDYLFSKNIKNLYGIDPTEEYVKYASQKSNCIIRMGCAEKIPFGDDSFGIVVLDQVLEHLAEPRKAFQEARRVLVNGGLFVIGVPDASRYNKIHFFDYYWFLLREHIQHFDIEHLNLLATQEGFELVSFSKHETPMNSETMMLPNLSAIFRLSGRRYDAKVTAECFNLEKEMEIYVGKEDEITKRKESVILELVESQKPVYAWGIGREFLYLYESVGLKQCAIAGLIDSNPYKQSNYMLGGKTLCDSSILNKATPDSILIITATAHTTKIQIMLKGIGYLGEVQAIGN